VKLCSEIGKNNKDFQSDFSVNLAQWLLQKLC